MKINSFLFYLKKNKMARYLYYLFTYYFNSSILFFSLTKSNRISNAGISIGTKYRLIGRNNSIIIKKNTVLKGCFFNIYGNNSTIVIEENSFMEGVTFHIEDNCGKIVIGSNTFIGASQLAVTENFSVIKVGNDCMISSNVIIRTGDSHSILDENHTRINKAESVTIGNHCWLSEGVRIMKGVILSSDVIVGTNSIVTKSFPSNVLVAGNPGKVIKNDVNWSKERV
jgi:acetyltransferase-like isoleucine patch superfamily enzyme